MGRIRSLLLGTLPRVVGTLVLVVGLVVGGGFALGVFGVPSVGGHTSAFGDVNDTTTAIETELALRNPNPVGVNLGGTAVDYSVRMNDVEMATGTKRGVAVPAGNSTVNLTTYMRNGNVPDWWVSHVSRGERTTVRLDATVHSGLLGRSVAAPGVSRTIETDLISAFNSSETRPVEANRPPVEDPVLYLNSTAANWGTVSEAETPIAIRFTVYNPKPYPIPVSEIGYDITMNDVAVGSGASERTYAIPPGETRTVETTTAIRNERIDDWWVSHLERNQVTDLRINFSARIDTQVAGTVRVPLRGLTYEETIRTDVLGSKNGTGEAGGDGTGAGGTGSDGTDGDGDSGATTADGTTTTTTDDGLLGGDTTDSGDGSGSTTATRDAPSGTTTTTDDGGLLDGGGNGTTDDGDLLAVGRARIPARSHPA